MLAEKSDLYLAAQFRFSLLVFLTVGFILYWYNYVMKFNQEGSLKTLLLKVDQ